MTPSSSQRWSEHSVERCRGFLSIPDSRSFLYGLDLSLLFFRLIIPAIFADDVARALGACRIFPRAAGTCPILIFQ